MQKKSFNIGQNIFFIFFCVLFFSVFEVVFPSSAFASSDLSLSPAAGSYTQGNTFQVKLYVNTNGDEINAAAANLTFDNTILNVSSIDTTGSKFTQWVGYPTFSNSGPNGTINFSGGLPKPGYNGAAGLIFVINFTGIHTGTGNVNFVPGSEKVLLDDGFGTPDFGTATGGSYTITPPSLSVSCNASPASINIGNSVTFSASASGETGTYTYSWTATGTDTTGSPHSCKSGGSTASSCSEQFNTVGTKTATVTVSSGGETLSKDCSATVGLPGLNVSCNATPNSTTVGQAVTFNSSVSGGVGGYTYSWTATGTDATGSPHTCKSGGSTASSCSEEFNTAGIKTATVSVTSGTQNSSSSCSATAGVPGVNVSCSPASQSVNVNDSVTFTGSASGGNGTYAYTWSKDCTGPSSPTCTTSYGAQGLKTATVTATSGGNSSSANCLALVNAVCPALGGTGTQYNACSFDGKCVSVVGQGQNQCQTDNDCAIAPAVTKIIEVPVKEIQAVTKTINTPQGSAITKTVSTTGAAVAAAVAAGTLFPFSLFDLLLLPLRLFALLMVGLGLKKRGASWGVVYDSVTKQPLDPAYIVLKDANGKEISSAVTDLDGRFGFLVEPGVYQMEAHKSNYNFPSQKLAGKAHDELYADLYFGENIIIKKSGETILKNIPLDPIKFDWNEFAKKNKNLMKFYSKWDVVLRKIYDFVFYIGLVVAVIAFIFAPYPYNLVIMLLYLALLLLRIFGLKPKTYGYIVDKATEVPLSFPIVRVVESDSNKEIASKSADRYGKYYCLVPPGKYYVKIEKKNEDGSYSLAYTSPTIDVSHKGIIKERFKI